MDTLKKWKNSLQPDSLSTGSREVVWGAFNKCIFSLEIFPDFDWDCLYPAGPPYFGQLGISCFFVFFSIFSKKSWKCADSYKGVFRVFSIFQTFGGSKKVMKSDKIIKTINRISEITVEPSYRDHLYSLIDYKSTEPIPSLPHFLRYSPVLSLLCLKARPDPLDLYGRVKLVIKCNHRSDLLLTYIGLKYCETCWNR